MGQCLSLAQQVLSSSDEPTTTTSTAVPTTKPQQHPLEQRISPVYASLPESAERVSVRNVYDGDTLTLTDERRVRFLGIDTPEIKQKQAYAQEAKAYTKSLCEKNHDVWISFESGHDKEDHYGRLLAFVWVKQSDGYLCLNEGIVAEGLANAYLPSQSAKLHNWDKFLALQDQACAAKKGIWSSFEDITVYKTTNGSAYHKRSCKHLQNSRNIIELKASEASAKGLHPCRMCLAD
jgi:micrococcal nuclease